MTGEMAWIKQNGIDSNGEEWPLHAAVAAVLDGELRPFDSYQGPYIVAGPYKYWIVNADTRGAGYSTALKTHVMREGGNSCDRFSYGFFPYDEDAVGHAMTAAISVRNKPRRSR